MRSRTLTSALVCSGLLLSVGSAAPAAPAAPAVAAGRATDWRIEACVEAGDRDSPIAGAHASVSSEVSRVSELSGVRLTAERLDFSGITCELLHVSGDIPAGATVAGSGFSYTTYFHLVVDGVDRGEVEEHSAFGGSTGLYDFPEPEIAGMPDPSDLFAAVAYRAAESGVMPVHPSLPADWQGKPYTATYLRSEWSATFNGTSLVAKPFDRTAATDRAARSVSTRTIAKAGAVHAATAAEIKRSGLPAGQKKEQLADAAATRAATITLARKTLRLALRGVRLVKQRFNRTYTGTLLP